MGWGLAWMVVFMPGDTTSIALGEKGRLSRNFVVVAPALARRALHDAGTWLHSIPRRCVSMLQSLCCPREGAPFGTAGQEALQNVSSHWS